MIGAKSVLQHRLHATLLGACLGAAMLAGCAGGGGNLETSLAEAATDDRPRIIQASRLDSQAQEAYRKGKLPEAEELWRRAIAEADDYWSPRHNLGVFYTDQGNFIGAVNQLRRAAELAPGDHRPLYHLGVAYYNAGYAREALNAFQRAYEVQPREAVVLRGIFAAARVLNHADPETLEAMRGALLVEQDPQWRDRFQREVRRQERQLNEQMRRG
jgi:Flp pilus assembly protein TadD